MTAKANNKPGCLSIFWPFLRHSKNESVVETLPYRLRDDFLSPAEFSFFKVLSSLISPRLAIQSKVRLADIFFVARPNENLSYFNRIAQLHLDFLVCDATTMKPLFGIELDDASHRRNDRQERDEFFEEVFQAADLPLLRVPVQQDYTLIDIEARIAPFLEDNADVSIAVSQPEIQNQVSSVPQCPKCDIPMVLRTAMQGEHKGKQFYGCPNYPRCREIKPVLIQNAG